MPKLSLKKLFFKRYKIWHYVLIFSILFLLFVLTVLLYNELVNEKKLIKYFVEITKTEERLQEIDNKKHSIIQAQESLIKYIVNNDNATINEYFKTVSETKELINSLQTDNVNPEISNLLMTFKDNEKENIEVFNQYLDSISENVLPRLQKNNSKITFDKNVINYDDLNIRTTIETKTEIDSVEKKKLFGRISDAIKGDVEVQKEKTEHVVIIEYGATKTIGNIEDQMQSFFDKISNYYEKKLSAINSNFSDIIKNNKELILMNNNIQQQSDKLLSEYEDALEEQKDILNSKYHVQYGMNRTIRFYTLLCIAAILIFLTVAVIYITKIIYDYEDKLIETSEILDHNLRIKNKMVSMISHDIRAPLSIISLYIKQLLGIEKDVKKKEVFESIDYTTNSALLLANRILDFSKNENKIGEVQKTTFDLNEEINQIVNAFTPLAVTRGNRIINQNNIPENTIIEFDQQKIQRIYFNLLDNAIKYTKNGNIVITSSIQDLVSGQKRFNLLVTDTGKGIKAVDLNKIFDPFEQVSINDLETLDLGVGLGLYLCKEIVNMFDGSIDVKSELGSGTEINLYIIID